ncbi:GCN5-related N-acetyltransferase [Burkholderia sp. H160]|nr:GCN5-related N-acetyltransferase [Burkholderia sp. H160]
MSDTIQIRNALPSDREDWYRLWAGYTAFYEATVPPQITARTWQRILEPESTMLGRVAECGGRVVAFSISILHEGTWVVEPICYLEDLFVDPGWRGQGIGRKLIEDLMVLGKARGWSRLYWHTRQDNPARRLYDTFAEADDFVRYRLDI